MKMRNNDRKRPEKPAMEQSSMLINHVKSSRALTLGEIPYLREGKTFYKKLVELSPVGICVVIEGRLCFGNQAMARTLGFTDPEEFMGMDVLRFCTSALSQGD